MGKLISQMVVSLDGFYEGPNREIDWHRVDEEYNEYAAGLLRSADAIVFGRTTYELMADYWPTEAAKKNDSMIAERMNRLPKIVFSATLRTVDWQPSTLAKGDLAEEIGRLKARYARNLVVLGSGNLVAALSARDLIDEYQLVFNPVVLGRGRPFQQQLNAGTKLELVASKAFRSGNALLCYRPGRNETTSRLSFGEATRAY